MKTQSCVLETLDPAVRPPHADVEPTGLQSLVGFNAKST